MAERDEHLTDSRLMTAVVDEEELEGAARAHLGACASCRGKKVLWEENLARLGRMAVEFSPGPARRPALRPQRAAGRSLWSLRPVFTMAFAAACLLVLVLAPWHSRKIEPNLDGIYQEMVQDRKLLSEVDKLEENPFLSGIPGLPDQDGTDESSFRLPGGGQIAA